MTIEVLYPEICYLYGDLMNVEYLRRCAPEAEIIKTPLRRRPAFIDGGVDMVYLCSMTERAQELVIEALRPHREKIEEYIESGRLFLATGNALEIFIRHIENEDGSKIEALGLFDLVARRRMMDRYNALYLGRFGDIEIVGFKSQFAHAYGEDGDELFHTVRGAGRNPGVMAEGIRRKNFMATYVLGPLLILNPPFTRHVLELLGAAGRPLAYEEAAMDSYRHRLKEFNDPRRGFVYR